MMFTVEWHRDAMTDLDTQFIALPEKIQLEIVALIRDAENQLAQSPHQLEESRSGQNRIVFFDRVMIQYCINDAARMVEIVSAQIVRGS